jgi:hypothetical protein
MSRHRKRIKLSDFESDFDAAEHIEAILEEISEKRLPNLAVESFLFSGKVKIADGLRPQRHEAFPASQHHPHV